MLGTTGYQCWFIAAMDGTGKEVFVEKIIVVEVFERQDSQTFLFQDKSGQCNSADIFRPLL